VGGSFVSWHLSVGTCQLAIGSRKMENRRGEECTGTAHEALPLVHCKTGWKAGDKSGRLWKNAVNRNGLAVAGGLQTLRTDPVDEAAGEQDVDLARGKRVMDRDVAPGVYHEVAAGI
jgi:hypothetical protein